MAILRELAAVPVPEGGTEFNRNLVLPARYLAQNARPGARRAIFARLPMTPAGM